MKAKKTDTKRLFLKKGTCSRTFFYILNREFGNSKEDEEQASDTLSGGLAQEGYQCGMLWGAALGAGAESFRRYEDPYLAAAQAITGTQVILESFINKAKSANCSVITNCDFSGKFALAKFLITGKPLICFNLADKWAPDAIQAAKAGLSQKLSDVPQMPLSCASETAKKMGAGIEEMVMVAGFAGGLGLSGNACGALAAAIWMNTLARVKKQKYKYSLSDKDLNKIVEVFHEETGYKMECSKICGRKFNTINEHSEFLKDGGCGKLINALAMTHVKEI